MHTVMRTTIACLVVLVAYTSARAAEEGNVDLPRYPSISPDGLQIVFSWRGDLWKVSSQGGSAQRLTSHLQDDLHSAWSRDGSRIAFTSTRAGSLNIHMMNADGTGLVPIKEPLLKLVKGPCGFGADQNTFRMLSDKFGQIVTLNSQAEHAVAGGGKCRRGVVGALGRLAPYHEAQRRSRSTGHAEILR